MSKFEEIIGISAEISQSICKNFKLDSEITMIHHYFQVCREVPQSIVFDYFTLL